MIHGFINDMEKPSLICRWTSTMHSMWITKEDKLIRRLHFLTNTGSIMVLPVIYSLLFLYTNRYMYELIPICIYLLKGYWNQYGRLTSLSDTHNSLHPVYKVSRNSSSPRRFLFSRVVSDIQRRTLYPRSRRNISPEFWSS